MPPRSLANSRASHFRPFDFFGSLESELLHTAPTRADRLRDTGELDSTLSGSNQLRPPVAQYDLRRANKKGLAISRKSFSLPFLVGSASFELATPAV